MEGRHAGLGSVVHDAGTNGTGSNPRPSQGGMSIMDFSRQALVDHLSLQVPQCSAPEKVAPMTI